MSIYTNIICDICDLLIKDDSTYVDAGAYGAHFHIDCITPDMYKIIIILSLDDISIKGSGGGTKLIYDSNLRQKILTKVVEQ